MTKKSVLFIAGLGLIGLLIGLFWRSFEEQKNLVFELARIKNQATAIVAQSFVESNQLPLVGGDIGEFLRFKQDYQNQGFSFMAADLTKMRIELYEEGLKIQEFPILSKGKDGSWWETPSGNYSVLSKEANHFSSIGNVWMPWSIQFYGNFFIHGWPYYPGGQPVVQSFSGGCIRLATEDAKAVFDFVKKGMPVLVLEKEEPADDYVPLKPASSLLERFPAGISARAALVADLKSGDIVLGKHSEEILTIASLTKLMTAVVASELINLEKSIRISPTMLSAPIQSYKFEIGDRYTAFELLYPLLMQSSNGAASALASFIGEAKFVEAMNNKARSIGMDNTNFVDPSGISETNLSTAKDLSALARYIYEKRKFIFGITRGKNYLEFGSSNLAAIRNFNEFYQLKDLIGSKNGQTLAAKQTLLLVFDFKTEAGSPRFAGEAGRTPTAVILLGSERSNIDARLLLDWLKNNFGVRIDI